MSMAAIHGRSELHLGGRSNVGLVGLEQAGAWTTWKFVQRAANYAPKDKLVTSVGRNWSWHSICTNLQTEAYYEDLSMLDTYLEACE